MPDRNDHHHQPAAFHDAAGSLNPNLNPETPHPETTRAHEEPLGSLFDDAYALYEDGKTYLEAEVAFQKSRASYASRETGSGIVFALGALAFLHLALIGLVVGLIIATEWRAGCLAWPLQRHACRCAAHRRVEPRRCGRAAVG